MESGGCIEERYRSSIGDDSGVLNRLDVQSILIEPRRSIYLKERGMLESERIS